MGTGPSSSPFLDRVREAIRVRHYSIRTEDAYVHWIKRFILFHKKRHPEEMGEVEVAAFLSYLATQRNVAASTQNQALNALVFLYKAVLEHPLETIGGVVRAKKPKRLPFVLSQKEVFEVLKRLKGWYWLLGCLLGPKTWMSNSLHKRERSASRFRGVPKHGCPILFHNWTRQGTDVFLGPFGQGLETLPR